MDGGAASPESKQAQGCLMRLAIPFLLVAAGLLAGAGRLAYIQHYEGARWSELAKEQHERTIPIPAQRGSILDSEGRTLASSVRRRSLYFDPTMVSDARFAAYTLAPLIQMPAAELETLLRDGQQRKTAEGKPCSFMWIKRRLDDAEADAVAGVLRGRNMRAFELQDEVIREYPQGRLACHVLGFFNEGGGAGAGIELQFDKALSGTDGSRRVIIDEDRERLAQRHEADVAPRDGHSVVLTIDSHLQRITERNLKLAVDEFKPEWAVAIVMDPKTGEVLAMASLPDFDPAKPLPPTETPAERALAELALRNNAIGANYEPGSIFKPFIAAPAYAEGLTRLEEVYEINGPTRLFGRRALSDTVTYDRLTLAGIISQSSNIGMALLGGRLGGERIDRYIRSFGFGALTNIELPGEENGQYADRAKWTSYSIQSLPIGQEISVTSIQLLTAFAALANEGVRLQPRIVRGIVGANGEIIEDRSAPIERARVMSSEAARAFRMEAMVKVVQEGTGRSAQIPDYQAFGKTGTAEIAAPSGRGYQKKYVGSFLGGAPAENPRAVAMVSIYKPSGSKYYGGTVAAPAVARILAETLQYLRVPPDAKSEVLPIAPQVDGPGGSVRP